MKFIIFLLVFPLMGLAQEISIMGFNVESLFDEQHDAGKADYTWQPLSKKRSKEHRKRCKNYPIEKWRKECLELDWNSEIVKLKLQRVGQVIRSVEEGRGPDLLILSEVENQAILNRLNQEELKKSEYQTHVLIEGNDYRGIDSAVLSRLPLAEEPKLHSLKGQGKDSRPILEVSLKLPDAKTLYVFAIHFPAPHHPTRKRDEAMKFVTNLMKKKGKEALVIAGGDFNIPFNSKKEMEIFSRAEADWILAHEHCKDCLGTVYYPPKKSWSFFDTILLSKSFLLGSWTFAQPSPQVIKTAPEQLTKEGFPQAFDAKTKKGVSDHLPFLIRIRAQR